jgi:hypothetical protein
MLVTQLTLLAHREAVLRRRVYEVMQRNAELLYGLQQAEQAANSAQVRTPACRPCAGEARLAEMLAGMVLWFLPAAVVHPNGNRLLAAWS